MVIFVSKYVSLFFSSISDFSSSKLLFLLSPSVSFLLCHSVYLTASRFFSPSLSFSLYLSLSLYLSFSLSLSLSLICVPLLHFFKTLLSQLNQYINQYSSVTMCRLFFYLILIFLPLSSPLRLFVYLSVCRSLYLSLIFSFCLSVCLCLCLPLSHSLSLFLFLWVSLS